MPLRVTGIACEEAGGGKRVNNVSDSTMDLVDVAVRRTSVETRAISLSAFIRSSNCEAAFADRLLFAATLVGMIRPLCR